MEAIDDFLPAMYSIEKWMIEYDISIPWLLHKDTGYTTQTELMSILHGVIDHDTHSDLMAYFRFRLHLIGEVVHEVDISILDICKISSHPAESTLHFPWLMATSGSDDRESLPTLIELLHAFYRVFYRCDISWGESRSTISFPEIAHFFWSDIASESGCIMLPDIFDRSDMQKLSSRLGICYESAYCRCERLVDVESDMSMCAPVECRYMWHE